MDEYALMKKPLFMPSTVLVCLCYSYFISSRIPKGFPRLISICPIIYHFTVLPLYLHPSFFLVFETALFIWPCSSRLAFFAFGKGPLASIEACQSLYNFIIYASLPIRNPSFSRLPRNQCKKKLLVIGIPLMFLVNQMGNVWHPKISLASHYLFLWMYLEVVRIVYNFLSLSLLGLELEQAMNRPYETTSLQDFWGNRWNLTITELLGAGVYRPVKSVSVKFLGNELARAVATMATFISSGFCHELLVFCFTRSHPSWEMTGFFVLHGICVVLEVRLKTILKRRGLELDLPGYVSMFLTLGFVLVTSVWLFFPPLQRNGVDVMVIQEFTSLLHLLMRFPSSLFVAIIS